MAAPSSSAHALGRGNAMPGRGLRLIAAVHDELQQMLQEGEGWLAKGKGWDRITSMRQDPHSYNASRLEKVVARLCGCSFWLVRKARSHSKKRDVAPMLRGRKRRRLEHATSSDGKESSKETFGGITALWEGGVEEASLQSTPARHRLGNVRGKFLPLAVGNPIQHAIGLTLGRLMVWSFVNGIPRAAMTGLMTQMTLAGVHLGDKYQDHNAMMTYTGIVFLVLQRLMRCRFNDAIPNLPFASAFRLIWDGITLRNGATVIPILVVFTNRSGEIVSEVVDIPLSKGSQGPETANTVFKVLEDILAIQKHVRYFSKAGLPLQNASAHMVRPRVDALTSMVVDRAYSGSTGNKADLLLGELLRLDKRVGLADKVHCCTTAASTVWDTKPKKAKGGAATSGIVEEVAATAEVAAASGIVAEEAEEVAEAEENGASDGDSDSSSSSSSSSSSGGGGGGASCPSISVERVPLCGGPGPESPPLCSLAHGLKPAAWSKAPRCGLKTWKVSDERVSVLRRDIGRWSSLCRSLSKLFGRGVNRNFLARAYLDHKIPSCPRILAPTKTRMIVYCGRYLDQSLRHHGARLQALSLAAKRLNGIISASDGRPKKQQEANQKLEKQCTRTSALEPSIVAPVAC